jgi:hypothetical protein
MTTSSLAFRGYTAAAFVALAAAIVATTTIHELRRPSSHVGATPRPAGVVAPLDGAWPAWFAPIARSYRGTAGITPLFDYASLYSAPVLDASGDVLAEGPVWPWSRTADTSIFSTSPMEAQK